MRKIKSSLKRLGTLGLAAVLLATSVPEYAFAEELSDIVAEADTMAGSELTAQQDILTETYGSDIDDASVTEESQEPAGHPVSEDIGTAGADERLDTDAGKISYPAFGKSRSLGGVKITVEADEGVFPEGAVFSVEKVTKEQERKAEEAVEEKRSEDQNVAVSYTYDIKVLDEDGNEIQPADESKVKVSFKLEEVADENLETNIYHITESDASNLPPDGTSDSEQTKSLPLEGKGDHEAVDEVFVAEKLTVETNGDTATAETDGFSLYTVEFTYNDLQYVMPGDSEIALSEILDKVGLAGEVTEVSVSDSSLFSAEKNDSGEWIVTTHQSFNTNEWMKVTINDVVYEITVTDTNGTLSGEGTAENPYIIGSISDWNTFAANVTDGTESYEEKFVKLAADLGTEDAPVTTMAGNSDTNCFKGTFDGGGHTLTISLTADGNDCAPFRYATGATISFLHIKGTVNAGNHQYAAGFIGQVCTGAVTIKNCWSSVTINGDMSADFYKTAEYGGFVGELNIDSGLSLTITNCLFDGVINVTDGIYSAGFIGEVYGPKPKAELNNCLMTGEINEGSNNFVFWNKASQGARTTVTDCYYDGNKDYSSLTIQGTATTETGESLAGLLGNGWRVSEDTVIPVMDVYNLSGATVEGVNEGGSYFYGGNAEGESVDYTVADLKGTVLKNGTHYSDMVLNSEGKIISKITSVGDYTLIITGMNPYYGTKIINFAVVTGADGYSYIDSAGNKKTTSVTGVITSENIPSTLTGWYIVQGDVSVDDRITVKGKANIILADGSSITAKSYIVNAGNTLNIYAQEEGTGKLSTSDAGDYYAGIGASGPYYGRKNCGNITINGGVITATGGMSAAAIGGTLDGNDGIVTINGGIINATGGKDAAAIGGGWRGHADVVINGGKITAIKSDEGTISCGIGSGTSGNGSTTVSLGWTRESDYIYSSGYTGSVSFQNGKVFVLDGTDTIATEGNIGGKKIVPASTDKLRLNMKNSKINGIAAAYNPNNSGIDLNYTVTDLTGTTLTKGTDYKETLTNDSTSAVVGKITGSGVYTLTVTGTGDENSGYYGSITSAIYVAGYKETLGGHEFTLTADEEGLYYPIDSEDALRALSSYVNNGGATSGKRFKQTENITLNGSFSPIGTGSSYKFQGTYDGGNKTISGLSVSGDVGFAALFGYICYATVKNVILISPNMSSSYYRSFNNTGSRVSALVGYMNTVTIDNCIVINPILNATGSGDNRVGVFIGEWGSYCSISNCCWYDSKAEHAYAPYENDENGDSIPAHSTAANIERVYKISASGCNTEAEGKVSIGGKYYLRKGTEVLVKASPSDGMWKFTAKGVTPSLTSKQGQYELTMPANDVTLGLAEVTPTIALSGGMVYDGEEKKPAITSVKDGDTTMTAGTDYTGVTYSNNINAGENTGVVSITGKGFYLGKATKSFTISPKPVTITGLSAENKIYDGSDTATVKGTASISGVRSGDAVSISAGTALFSDKNVGTNKTVTFSDYSLSGTESGNYVLSTQPTSVKANITPQTVTVESGITATDKTYDGNTAAILNCESAVLTGKVNGDELTVSATGAFEDANAGTNKNVNISGFTLGGADKDNYVLAESGHQTVATASISKKTAP
nr:hypothetical protein [Lachnospiraceae bacterium]